MSTPLRVPHALIRSLGPAFFLALVLLLSPVVLFGQVTIGLAVTKTCPTTASPGGSITCTFSVTNQNAVNGVNNLTVTNQVPFPAGPITAVQCLQGGNPVTTLGTNGSATAACTGSVLETAPACGGSNIFFTDQIAASGQDAGNPLLIASGAATNAVLILACTPTPTPTNTPVNTPTDTPTNTPTNTPVQGVPPVVPTLSFPMMALLGLLLAAAGLFLARR